MPLKDPEKRRAYHAEYMRTKWYPANKERHRASVAASSRKRIERQTAMVAKIKSVPCMDCGGTFPSEAMDFDHVRGEKLCEVSILVRNCGPAVILAEIEKCDLVCSNCHRIRTAMRRRGGAVGSSTGS